MMPSFMRTRTPLELSLLIGLGLAGLLRPTAARAADDEGRRFGLVATVGGGVAGVLHTGPLPGAVGYTTLGVEALAEVRPWGGFLRLDYLSSGSSGRWTALALGAGVDRRLFGDLNHTALFLRGGLAYERWSGNAAGCPVDFFVPVSCNLEGAGTSPFNVTADMVGFIGGARLELPTPSFYLALAANVVPTVGLDGGYPAGTLQLRFDLELGFRDTRQKADIDVPRDPNERRRRGGTGVADPLGQ